MEKAVVKLLKVKMPGLIRLNSAAGGEGQGGVIVLMYGYIWLLFCSCVLGRYSVRDFPDLTFPLAAIMYFMKIKNVL